MIHVVEIFCLLISPLNNCGAHCTKSVFNHTTAFYSQHRYERGFLIYEKNLNFDHIILMCQFYTCKHFYVNDKSTSMQYKRPVISWLCDTCPSNKVFISLQRMFSCHAPVCNYILGYSQLFQRNMISRFVIQNLQSSNHYFHMNALSTGMTRWPSLFAPTSPRAQDIILNPFVTSVQ